MSSISPDAQQKLIVIAGPTASGKTAISVELALRLGGEIVSADSMQVYRHMDIGTAKATPAEMRGVPHHLIDIVDPREPFSVAEYQRRARDVIGDIAARGKLPILAGGTGLYIRSVIDELEFPSGDISSVVRARLEHRAESEGSEALYGELLEKDPAAADIVHPNNARRVIRALEVIELTGRPFSEFHSEWKSRVSRYELAMFGLTMERQLLHERINERVDAMVASGLLDEVRRLMDAGYEQFLTSQQAIGYKEFIGYYKGNISLEDATETLKTRTRQYAKRQLTWFRADPRIIWVDVGGKTAPAVVDELVAHLDAAGFISKG